MKKSELAEIRALLQASAEVEGRRPHKPLLGAFRTLLASPVPTTAPASRPAYPPPRRAGLSTREGEGELLLAEAEPLTEAVASELVLSQRRSAFGHRREARLEGETRQERQEPLLLEGPHPALAMLDESDVGEALRRLGSVLARSAPPPSETPYLPEDLMDEEEVDAERLYALAGIEVPPRQTIMPEEQEPLQAPNVTPDRAPPNPAVEILVHLERVFLVERAVVDALRPAC